MRAVPDFTRTSLPLRSTVFTWPWTTSTLIGPVMAMASPSMTPMLSPGGGVAGGLSAGGGGEVLAGLLNGVARTWEVCCGEAFDGSQTLVDKNTSSIAHGAKNARGFADEHCCVVRRRKRR